MNNILTTTSEVFSLPGNCPITADGIIKIIEQYYHLKPGEIKMKTRIAEVRKPRQIAIWFIANYNIQHNEYNKPEWSKIISRHFPLFDHATLIHSFHTTENEMQTNKVFRKEINDIQLIIKCKNKTIKP